MTMKMGVCIVVDRVMKLRDYQIEGAKVAADSILKYGIHYLAWGVRTGKTLTALQTAKELNCKNVLFLTKKKAMGSVQSDYDKFGYHNHYNMTVMNNESLHKLEDNDFDLIIMDEAHRLGGFPKPSKIAKDLRSRFSYKPFLFLSGTPSPENYSQIYHQFWVSSRSPFAHYKNFYAWARDYVNITQKRIGMNMHNDYSNGKENEIMADVSHLISTRTQEQSGFTSEIKEIVLYVKMKPITYKLCKELLADAVVEGNEEVILADTAAKMMQKLHQLYSGTVKFESENAAIIDTSKAEFIKEKFKNKKLAILYIFKKELDLLCQVFGEDNLTSDIDEFNNTDKHYVGQVVSSREGINLSKADYLIMYNIQHSAVSYFQARDRLTTIDRPKNDVFWIFSEGGIEEKIYKVVKSKKKYTTNIFKKDYNR